jgi:putative ABC transport system ATP-binding protein
MTSDGAVVEAIDVTRTYMGAGRMVTALDHASLSLAPGEVVAVTGPSGSGKSTLLYLLGGLDIPDAGVIRVTGVDLASLRGSARAAFLRRACGFIVQGMALLPQATAAENVEVPLLLDGVHARDRRRRVSEALDRVGLLGHGAKLTDQLSGGEQQRVSIARALVHDPALILADEPTGSLDSASAEAVTDLLVSAAVERGAAVAIVTHDPAVAAHAGRVLRMRSGRLDSVGDEATGQAADA